MGGERAFQFALPGDHDVSSAQSGYLKLFVANEYIDLDWIQQELSPFDQQFDGVRGRRIIIKQEDMPMWDALTVLMLRASHSPYTRWAYTFVVCK